MALTDSLVAYWSLDEASGTRVDATGRGNDAAVVGSVSSATGLISNAAALTSTSNYLNVGNVADVTTGDLDFTLTAWVWLNSVSNGYSIVTKWGSIGTLEYALYNYGNVDDQFRFFVSPDGSDFSNVVIASNLGAASTSTWYFLVCWHDATANTINIQGNDGTVNTVSYSSGVFASTSALQCGVDGFGNTHDGRLDEVGFWKRVLTSGERTQLYNAGAGLAYGSFGGATAVPVFAQHYQMMRAS